MKMYAPDGACKSVEVEGARTGRKVIYDRQKDGAFHVENKSDIRALKAIGCFFGNTRVGGKGYRCQDCGFLAVFKKCGRCGSEDTVLEES